MKKPAKKRKRAVLARGGDDLRKELHDLRLEVMLLRAKVDGLPAPPRLDEQAEVVVKMLLEDEEFVDKVVSAVSLNLRHYPDWEKRVLARLDEAIGVKVGELTRRWNWADEVRQTLQDIIRQECRSIDFAGLKLREFLARNAGAPVVVAEEPEWLS